MRRVLGYALLIFCCATASTLAQYASPALLSALTQLPAIATNTILGNNTAGTASPTALTATNVWTLFGTFAANHAITGGGASTLPTDSKVTITAPATGSTLTIADGKTLTDNNTLTLAGTDSTTITFQATDTYVGRATTDTLTNKTMTDPIEKAAHEGSFTSSGTGLGNIAGLSQSLTAAGVYSCQGFMHFTTASTTSNGVKLALATSDTLTITTLNFTAIGFNGAAFATSGTNTATALAATAISSQNAFTDIILQGEIVVNVAGTLQVQVAEVAASGTIAGNARWDCHRAS